jgi:hypothetical protein
VDLFNHPVGGHNETLRHRDIKRLGGLEVYNQLEFCGQLR